MNQLFTTLISLAMLTIFIWIAVGLAPFVRREGKLKRGVRVWSEVLPKDMGCFFRSLSRDIVENDSFKGNLSEAGSDAALIDADTGLIRDVETGFIRVEGEEILVQCRRRHWRTCWPYVAYIDLESVTPTIEYRTLLPSVLFLAPFVLSVVGIPFVALLMCLNHSMEKGAILALIRRYMHDDSVTDGAC